MKTIAFIPVRGGSKSIPLKNIKKLCGKPLVCWNIEALEQCSSIDVIVVATDSQLIENEVVSKNYKKTAIYHRSPENASDTSSTESVMIEYLKNSCHQKDDIFILVQATSPFTKSEHFSEALAKYKTGGYDSMLSCVRNKRFFWNEAGTPLNYDYHSRPRRQNFDGQFMENGAFYINTVGNVLQHENRLCGSIGIYEMPEYSGNEIDEPDDWTIIEALMRRHVSHRPFTGKDIKLFLTDVDGVLTDAGMYYSEHGDELKKFNTRDGMGLKLLQQNGIKTGIITTETTRTVENRARKLNVDFLFQGRRDGGKLAAAQELCKKLDIAMDNVAYIGDDVNCYELLSSVGMAACPSDAMPVIKNIPHILCLSKKGGEGCVREFAELIIANSHS